jgi:hypothetical protein
LAGATNLPQVLNRREVKGRGTHEKVVVYSVTFDQRLRAGTIKPDAYTVAFAHSIGDPIAHGDTDLYPHTHPDGDADTDQHAHPDAGACPPLSGALRDRTPDGVS